MQYYSEKEALDILKGPTFELLLNKEFKAYFAKGGEGIPALLSAGLSKTQISEAFKKLGQYPVELKNVKVVGGGEGSQSVTADMIFISLEGKRYSVEVEHSVLEDLEFPEHSLPAFRYENKWQVLFRSVVLDAVKVSSKPEVESKSEVVERKEPKVFLTTATTAVRKGIMAIQKMDKTNPNLWGSTQVDFPLVVEADGRTDINLVKISLFELDLLLSHSVNPKEFVNGLVKGFVGYKLLDKWTLDMFFKGAAQAVRSYKNVKDKPSASVMATDAVTRLQKSVKIWSK